MKVLFSLSLFLNLLLFASLAVILGTQLLPPKAPSPNEAALESHVVAMIHHLRWGGFLTHHNPATAVRYGSWVMEHEERDQLMHAMAEQSETLPEHLAAFEKVAADRMNTLIENTEKLALVESELEACQAGK